MEQSTSDPDPDPDRGGLDPGIEDLDLCLEDPDPDREVQASLDGLLGLEERYYAEGYLLGVADGTRAGHVEGRVFGMEKGCEKFAEMGRLAGRAAVWGARLARTADGGGEGEGKVQGGERLAKHVQRLTRLTDVETLSMENSEEAVGEFDDRLRDARAKATLISRVTGEGDVDVAAAAESGAEASPRPPARSIRMKQDGRGGSGEMEDFVGLPRGAARPKRDDVDP